MVRRMNVSFRMGHQAHHSASGIAQSRQVIGRTVGVERVGDPSLIARNTIAVPQRTLLIGAKFLQLLRISENELAFGVRDRQVHSFHALEEYAAIRVHGQINPAILEFPRIIPTQRGQRLGSRFIQQQP